MDTGECLPGQLVDGGGGWIFFGERDALGAVEVGLGGPGLGQRGLRAHFLEHFAHLLLVTLVGLEDLDDQLHDQFVAARALVGRVKHAETTDQAERYLEKHRLRMDQYFDRASDADGDEVEPDGEARPGSALDEAPGAIDQVLDGDDEIASTTTDANGEFPPQEPRYPVIWLVKIIGWRFFQGSAAPERGRKQHQ